MSSKLKKTLVVFVAILIVAALGAGGYALYYHHSGKAKNLDKIHQQKAVAFQQRQQSKLDEVKKRVAADSGQPAGVRGQDYLDLATAYLNVQQYKEGIDYCQKALATAPELKRQAMGCLFNAYALSGQTKQAIDEGNQLIAYLKTLPSTDEDPVSVTIQNYESSIKRLQAGEGL